MTVCCKNCKHLKIDSKGDALCYKNKTAHGGILWLMHDIDREVCTHWEARQ